MLLPRAGCDTGENEGDDPVGLVGLKFVKRGVGLVGLKPLSLGAGSVMPREGI